MSRSEPGRSPDLFDDAEVSRFFAAGAAHSARAEICGKFSCTQPGSGEKAIPWFSAKTLENPQ